MKKIIVIIVLAALATASGIALKHKLSYDFITLDGSKIVFKDLNEHWIVVNYFAEWCAPCLREIPELNKLKKLSDNHNIKVFGVSFDDLSEQQLVDLKLKYNIEYALITDIKTQMPFEMPKYLPATYLIKPDGTVAGQLLGEQKAESLLQTINKLKQGKPATVH